jgi:hypothetical protein
LEAPLYQAAIAQSAAQVNSRLGYVATANKTISTAIRRMCQLEAVAEQIEPDPSQCEKRNRDIDCGITERPDHSSSSKSGFVSTTRLRELTTLASSPGRRNRDLQ